MNSTHTPEMTKTEASNGVILNRTHPVGRAFVQILADGRIRAGQTQETASTFDSVKVAYEHWIGRYREGSMLVRHTAWNICSVLEDVDADGIEA